MLPPNNTRKYAYEQASKKAKAFWALGHLMMTCGTWGFGLSFFAFTIQSDNGNMSNFAVYMYFGMYAICALLGIVGYFLVKFAQLYQWWDRGGIKGDIFKD